MPRFSNPPRCACGAIGFLAALAFPESAQKANEFADACKAFLIKRHKNHPEYRKRIAKKWRNYPSRAIFQSGPITRAAHRIIVRRLPAAKIAVARMLVEASSKHFRVETFLEGERTGSLDNATLAVVRALKRNRLIKNSPDDEVAKKNFLSRAWPESKPVLHLAVAFDGSLGEQETTLDILKLLLWDDWLPGAVADAERLRVLMGAFRSLRFDPGKAVRVCAAESEGRKALGCAIPSGPG